MIPGRGGGRALLLFVSQDPPKQTVWVTAGPFSFSHEEKLPLNCVWNPQLREIITTRSATVLDGPWFNTRFAP